MKKNRIHIYFLFIILFQTGLLFNSSLAQNKIKIKLHQPPPNQLSVGDVWKMSLENLTDSTLDIYLIGSVDKENTKVVDGTSATISLPPGKSNYNYRSFETGSVNWYDNTLKEFILRTGNVPAGNFETCIQAFSSNNNIPLSTNTCITIPIIRGPTSEITLISPADGESLGYGNNVDLILPRFSWSSPGSKGPYNIVIKELKKGQTSEQAMNENKDFFIKKNLRSTSYQYGTADPKMEEGKDYVWRVGLNGVWSEIWMFRPRPFPRRKFSCKDFKVSIVKSDTCRECKDGCCYNLGITNNYGGLKADSPQSFRIITNSASIVSAAGVPTGWNQSPSTFLPNTNSVVWNKTLGPLPTGVTNITTICLRNITKDPFYVIYELMNPLKKVICRDSVKVICGKSKPCVGFFTGYTLLNNITYNNYFSEVDVSFTTSTPFSSVTATVVGAFSSSTGQNLAVEIEESYINSLPASQAFSGQVWKSISPANNCDLKLLLNFEPKPQLNHFDNLVFQIRYSFCDEMCNSCDTIIEYSHMRFQHTENLYDYYEKPNQKLNLKNHTVAGNLSSPFVWEIPEHATQITKDVLKNDWHWTNFDAILKVADANVCTDVADLGPIVQNAYCLIKPENCDRLECVKKVLSTSNFNQYPIPHEWSSNGNNNTHGFHFDNCFTYSDIESRWTAIDNWISQQGQALQDSARKNHVCNIDYWLCLMGVVFHAVQDFYCHSNWVLINSVYGANNSLDPEEIPTWEEMFGFWGDPWMSQHTSFNKQNALNNMQYSNYKSVKREFNKRKKKYRPTRGLQTGRWDGIISLTHYRAQNSGVKPWGHRHANSQTTPYRRHKIEKYYNYFSPLVTGPFAKEKDVAIELSKRATKWWLMRLTHPQTLGTCYQEFVDYITQLKEGEWPDFEILKRDIDEDSENEEETTCMCKDPIVTSTSIQYQSNGEFLLKFNINKQNIDQLSVTMLDAETEMTNYDPIYANLEGQVWSNVSSNFNLPGFTSTSLNNRRDVIWNTITPTGNNMNNSQLEIVVKFPQPVSVNQDLSFCLGFEFLSGNKLCTQTVSIGIPGYNTGLSGNVSNADIEIY